MRRATHKKGRAAIVSGEDAIAMFEAMCLGKPGSWFSTKRADGQITIHSLWCAGWWLCITESTVEGIIASYGMDLSRCTALGRAKSVSDAKEALMDLLTPSDEEAEAIHASGSIEEARELMRAVIEINKRGLYGI